MGTFMMRKASLILVVISVGFLGGATAKDAPKAATNPEKKIDFEAADKAAQVETHRSLEKFDSSKKKTKSRYFKRAMADANLVIQGRVVEKRFGKSEGSNGLKGLPLTFVDFEVLDVIKGTYDGDIFTLRHLGGKMSNGTWAVPTHIHHYNVGDEEIVFISNNGDTMEPTLGRMRVFDGLVYSASGHQLVEDDEGNALVSSNKINSETVASIQLGDVRIPAENNVPQEHSDMSCNDQNSSSCRPLGISRVKSLLREEMDTLKMPLKSEVSANDKIHRKFK
jgi:hypothetical protein